MQAQTSRCGQESREDGTMLGSWIRRNAAFDRRPCRTHKHIVEPQPRTEQGREFSVACAGKGKAPSMSRADVRIRKLAGKHAVDDTVIRSVEIACDEKRQSLASKGVGQMARERHASVEP